jgi:hypothetical protein
LFKAKVTDPGSGKCEEQRNKNTSFEVDRRDMKSENKDHPFGAHKRWGSGM